MKILGYVFIALVLVLGAFLIIGFLMISEYGIAAAFALGTFVMVAALSSIFGIVEPPVKKDRPTHVSGWLYAIAILFFFPLLLILIPVDISRRAEARRVRHEELVRQ